ncbi:unnamed protein product [Agarophyton chilense]
MAIFKSSVLFPQHLVFIFISLLFSLTFASNASLSPTNCLGLSKCLENLASGQSCGVIPIPSQARVPSTAPGTFILKKLRPGVWAYDNTAYNALMLYRARHLVLIDFPDSGNSNTPNGTGTLLTDAILDIVGNNQLRLIDLVYSHDHFDHIGAAKRVYDFSKERYSNAFIRIWGTYVARRAIKNSDTNRAVLPTVIVGRYPRSIYMGNGLRVKLLNVGGHSGRDLAAYIPPSRGQQGVVLFVDVIFPKWAPFPNFGITEDLTEYVAAHRRLLKLNFGTFLGGHVLIGTKRDVQTNLEFTQDVIDAARKSVQMSSPQDFQKAGAGKVSDPEAAEFGNFWFVVVDVIRRVQVNTCARMVLEKWACRLGGIGVVIQSHCFTAVTFIGIAD